jgi:1-deoxy-D-xylulose-5-phosphate reductoisomerase
VKKRKNIAILGSTGSIGRSSLEVIAACPDRFRLTYLTGHRNIELLQEQIRQFKPRAVAVREESNAALLRQRIGNGTEVLSGEEGLREIVSRDDVDVVISSLVGFAGLKPTLWALDAGKSIALANKETLVTGGEIIMKKVQKNRVRLLPVDSEHSAILQCLQGENPDHVSRLILTASGGPFLHLDKKKFSTITRAQALAHPTWKMGSKVTIDSATLMNKGLEVIEAYWLFGLPVEKIDVVVHPQSIIHSMVEFVDGSIKAQLGVPDMKIPIQYALTYPDRFPASYGKVDFAALGQMTFFKPDLEKFRCLGLAFQALRAGGTAPAVLNAANEVAVGLFLDGNLPFSSIPDVIEQELCRHKPVRQLRLEDIIKADKETREHVRAMHAPNE